MLCDCVVYGSQQHKFVSDVTPSPFFSAWQGEKPVVVCSDPQ